MEQKFRSKFNSTQNMSKLMPHIRHVNLSSNNSLIFVYLVMFQGKMWMLRNPTPLSKRFNLINSSHFNWGLKGRPWDSRVHGAFVAVINKISVGHQWWPQVIMEEDSQLFYFLRMLKRNLSFHYYSNVLDAHWGRQLQYCSNVLPVHYSLLMS